MMDYKKFAAGLRSAAGSYALFYSAPRGELEKAADVIEELAAKLEPSSKPLTLEELREMDGEPVRVVNSSTKREEVSSDEWALVSVRRKNTESVGAIYHFENYGDAWRAYRYKLGEKKT